MCLGVGQYSREVAQDSRRYFLRLKRELDQLKEEQRLAEEKRVNSMPHRLEKLVQKFKK